MKIAIIKDIRAFLSVARLYRYSFYKNFCTKTIIYDALDCIIEIRINLNNGVISFISFANNVSFELELEDKKYLLKEIDYLIRWVNIECLKEEN